MKYIESLEVAMIYLNRIRDLMMGKTSMKEVSYPPRPIGEVHASHLDGLCPLQAYYEWTLPDVPPHDGNTLMNFCTGRMFEHQLATELPPIVKDGIQLTLDDDLGEDGICELKFTKGYLKSFQMSKYPWWICRCKQYCKVREVDWMNLAVGFLNDVVLKAWRLEFTQEEIDSNWDTCLNRRDLLLESVRIKDPTILTWYKDALKRKQCSWGVWKGGKGCRMKPVCHIYNTEVLPSL